MLAKMNASLKAIGNLIALGLLLFTAACNSKGNTKDIAAVITQPKPKPPKIDLHSAVLADNLDAVKQHIAAGSNLNVKDPFGGSSPLITAALFDKERVAKTLIDAGADINFQNNDGSTALHTAAFFCRTAIVKMLIDKAADKTIKNKYGSTAYTSVAGPFNEVKNSYEMLEKMLEPIGLKLDYSYLEKTRPVIAEMLK